MPRFAIIADRLWNGTDDQPQTGQALILQDDKIESVLPASDLSADVLRLDFPGCTVLPGMIDAHVHYSAALGPSYLAAGVTTVRDVGNDPQWIVRQRAIQAKDMATGPAIVCCGYLLYGKVSGWQRIGLANADAPALIDSIRQEVELGVDAIKFGPTLDLPTFTAGIAEAHRLNKWTLCHLGDISAEDAARAGLDEIQHLTGCGAAWKASTLEEIDALIDVLLEHEVAVTPTLVVWDRLGRVNDNAFQFDIRRRWIPPIYRDFWNRWYGRFEAPTERLRLQAAGPHLKRCLARMQERGVTIAVGTDSPFPHLLPGFSVHDELAMFVDAGIKPVDALRSATSVGARVVGLESHCGRLAPGLAADVVVVDGNPLYSISDISNVQCVVRGGRAFRLQELFNLSRAHEDQSPDDPVTNDVLCCRVSR